MSLLISGSNIRLRSTPPIWAEGGDVVYDFVISSVVYRVHVFTTVGIRSLNVVKGGTFEYLVVGGGGGGGVSAWGGGGGGAGGYRSSVFGELSGGGSPAEPALTLTAQNYSIVVGNGGLGGAGGRYGVTGGDSSFGGITSKGGGGGGNGGVFGSGGGQNYGPFNDPFRSEAPGLGTSGQGYGGGFPFDFPERYGGGPGGGASQPGIGGAAYNNSGGAGLASSIMGNSITYASGGRPGSTDYRNGGNGAGYGYGGEGGFSNGSSGNGGSGIVIVRYAI